MKTTVVLKDDVFRRAKSRAALLGIPLSLYLEECLEASLEEAEPVSSLSEWVRSLPTVSKAASKDLKAALSAKDFRPVEPGMWE